MTQTIWTEGHNNFRQLTFKVDPEGKNHSFHIHIDDVELMGTENIHDIFNEHLKIRQTKFVEVLYSGGSDSEAVLLSCIHNKIPFKAITAKICVNGFPVNTHDLYYSEKFCRENNIEQKIIEFHADKFFSNGDHFKYLDPYHIMVGHVATHIWLFEQCSGFPVLGGAYFWPWSSKPLLSPMKNNYSRYDQILVDRGIHGIGNMLGHSLDSNIQFAKKHLQIYNHNIHDGDRLKITKFKQDLLSAVGLGNIELRMKYYGWDNILPEIFDITVYNKELLTRLGKATNTVSWGKTFSDILGGPLKGFNNRFK